MTKEQKIERRIEIIKDNINKLIDFIDENRMMELLEKQTKYNKSAWSHIINIERACDLDNDEI